MDLLAHQSVMKTPRGADSQSAAPRLVSASGRTSTRVSMLHRRVRAPQDVFNDALPRTLSPDKSYAPLRSRLGNVAAVTSRRNQRSSACGSLVDTSKKRFAVKLNVLLSILMGAGAALAQQPDQPPSVRHVIGLETIKLNANGHLTIQNGVMQFSTKTAEAKVKASSIEDVFVGTETTQSGGTAGKVVKTAAIAAPFGSGKALTLLMRTKVDILTVVFRGPDGGVHGAIFALQKGQAESTRTQLVAAGAHISAPQTVLKDRTKP